MISKEDREEAISVLREQKDELSNKDWDYYSTVMDFTVDEVREFQDYINFRTYYTYCSQKSLNISQFLEFRKKYYRWTLIFCYKYLGERLFRRFVNECSFTHTSWRCVFDRQKVSKQFRHRYRHLLKKD